MDRNNPKVQLGKMIEGNIVKSLKMAGVNPKTSPDYDHNYKIDFALNLKNQIVGVQVSLRQNHIKATIAKICALDVVSRFIYLIIPKEIFARPDKQNGRDLYLLLSNTLDDHTNTKALMLNINLNGLLQVRAL